MATDDERRLVAERMRASAGKYDFCASNIALDMGIVGSDYSEGYNARHHLAWLRLADLIDPDCEEGRYSVARTARPVDREALLALADELEGEGLDGWASGPVNVGEYARRIREACGEVAE